MAEFLYLLGNTSLVILGVTGGLIVAIMLIAAWCWFVETYPWIAIPFTVAVTILTITLIRFFGGQG